MTNLLKKAFDEASRLPKGEQDALAKLLLEELKSQRRWDRAFAASHDRLSDLADEAMEEHRQGDTQKLEPEKL